MSNTARRTGMKSCFTLTAISLIILCAAALSAHAQNPVESNSGGSRPVEISRTDTTGRDNAPAVAATPAPGDAKKKESDSSTEVGDRVRALEEKLDEMQRTIEAQQQTIKALSNKLGGVDAATPSVAANATGAAAAPVGQQTPAPSIDDRVKKLEGQVTKFGPFRFSGDFRLRADGIFRKADPNPPPGFAPLTHQQNARVRYRLRLNFDTDLNSKLSFHGQLTTGPINNALTNDQDFGETVARHPFFINEAWIDYHPNKSVQLQAGRLQEVFADNSRFLFDDDVRFSGFNEKYVWNIKHPTAFITSVEARAGQYIFSNPNVAIVTAGSPLAQAGAVIGSTGRSSNLFHQGLLFNQKYNEKWSGQFGGDVQIFRNPNQIQLASTANGVVLIVQNGLGLTLSGPMTGTGNATTTNGGAIYTARNFEVARFTFRLNWAGFKSGDHAYPLTFNVQGARNVGVGIDERDAMLAAVQLGKITRRGDTSYLYIFTVKGANSIISQLTDDDIGTNSGVNIRTHAFRFEYGVAKKVTLQSLVFIQNELRNSGQFPNFFVPLSAFTPRQYRFQEQLVFNF